MEFWLLVFELVILGIFCIEIGLHIYAFRCLYFSDVWNILDIIVILLSILFVVLDMVINNSVIKDILKIRGVFRLLRLFILIRKLNELRKKNEARKK